MRTNISENSDNSIRVASIAGRVKSSGEIWTLDDLSHRGCTAEHGFEMMMWAAIAWAAFTDLPFRFIFVDRRASWNYSMTSAPGSAGFEMTERFNQPPAEPGLSGYRFQLAFK
jgi:hypothetical protein